jgi:predicted RNase H-like HicB family nuclease
MRRLGICWAVGGFHDNLFGQQEEVMTAKFTLEYWIDDGWYVGRLREVPGVFSQGETLKQLEDNIRDAYRLMVRERPAIRRRARSKPIAIPA